MKKGLLDVLAKTADLEYLSDLRYAAPEIVGRAVSATAKEAYTSQEWKEAYRYLLGKETGQDRVDEIVAELLDSLLVEEMV